MHRISFVEGVLSGILGRYINAGIYKLGSDAFDWNGFLDCVRQLAKEVSVPLNDVVKKMLTANEMTFHKWQNETDRNSEIGSSPKTTRPWDAKKVSRFEQHWIVFNLSLSRVCSEY